MSKKFNPAHILFEKQLSDLRLEFEREYQFDLLRKWRADYLITSRPLNGQIILVEIEGGVFSRGRHVRGVGYENDMRKYNAAQSKGYYVFRFSTNMVNRGEAKEFLRLRLSLNGAKL